MAERKNLNPDEITPVCCDSSSQEVSISFDRSGNATMYVSYNPWLNKMKNKLKENPEIFKCYSAGNNMSGPSGYFFEFPSKLVSIRSKIKRNVSEEEKSRFIEMVKQRNKNKN